MICVDSVTVNPKRIELKKGQWYSGATAVVSPQDATCCKVTWSSSNTDVATVNASSGRIYANKAGTAKIYATATDGSGKSDYIYVIVKVPVNTITVEPAEKTLTVGESMYARAVISPASASDRTVCWSSKNPNVATVIPHTGLVMAQSPGTTQIYATAKDGSGISGFCCLTVVGPVRVSSITLSATKKTIQLGTTEKISAVICPENAADKSVTWSSSNTDVATVSQTGNVTALREGTTTITATTDDGNLTASCIVTVDRREKVLVKKDSHSFYVKFADGKVWKSIGIDLSNRQENYNQMYPPPMWYDNYEYLIEEEQRFLDNYQNFYSEKQFALLYLLDPFGVEYYLSQYNTTKYVEQFPGNFENYNDKLRACLKFKDRIYKDIFGRSPTPFVLSDDGRRVNVTWSYDRIDVFMDSELIFGAHNIVDMIGLLERAVDLIIHLVDSILPDTTKNKWIMRGVNAAKTLLFSGSIVEAFSDAASDFLDDYIEDSTNGKIKIMEWPNPLLDNIYNFKKGIDEILTLPNIHDIKICDKVNKQSNYNVEFSNGSFRMFVGEVLELCS